MKISNCRISKLTHYLLLTVCVILLSSSICYSENGQTNRIDSVLDQRCEEAELILKDTMAATGAPGGLNGIYSPQGNCVIAEGYADLKNNLAIKSTDPFRIGSITKSFVATLVLLLTQEEKLFLDEKIERFLPNFPHSDKITIRHLLGHRSGIPTWDEDETIRNNIIEHPDRNWTVDLLIEKIAQKPLLFEPGEGYAYSNIGYFLLGKIIEKATGDSVANQLRLKITDPLRLKHTFFLEQPHFPDELIRGYEEKDGIIQDTTDHLLSEVINYRLAYTAGGMVSTLEDLHIFAKALATGQLLDKKMHDQQMPQKLVKIPGKDILSGMGLGLSKSGCWIGHNGAIAGYFANMSYCVDNDVTIVSFFNKFSALDTDANKADIAAYVANFKSIVVHFFPQTVGLIKKDNQGTTAQR